MCTWRERGEEERERDRERQRETETETQSEANIMQPLTLWFELFDNTTCTFTKYDKHFTINQEQVQCNDSKEHLLTHVEYMYVYYIYVSETSEGIINRKLSVMYMYMNFQGSPSTTNPKPRPRGNHPSACSGAPFV